METQSLPQDLVDDEDSYQSDLMEIVDHSGPLRSMRPTRLSTELLESSDAADLGCKPLSTRSRLTEQGVKFDRKRAASSSQPNKNRTDKQKRKIRRPLPPCKSAHSERPASPAMSAQRRGTPSSLNRQTEMTVIQARRMGSDSWFPQISSVRAPVAKMRFGSQKQPSMDLPSAMQLARSASVPDSGLRTNSLKRIYSLHNRRPHEVHRAAVERLGSNDKPPLRDRGQLAFGVVRLLSEEEMLKNEDGTILSGGVGKQNLSKGHSVDGYYEKGSLSDLEKRVALVHEPKRGGNKTRRCFTD
ncbi:hypothetical protein BWQ96_03131 [Gracilariopsis chorda]|uniref:Uncharacterized protein n=1 Tax=Gracilariopsis chorda TaxID=448386 RepID=A0A2V3IY33_9FLOR|nr:hypothetical protein BWQ96_03131 [Gracilariopsis chorda]|eukprot:PXF47054.1 hypothetical protein BWQ96_03131 [Gracilariopsis chorda]